ncbi:MAG TPA: aminotransferase class IV, partial [Solirubrobacteraceae bacterium]
MTTDSQRRPQARPDFGAPGDWPAVLDGELMRTSQAMIPATDDGLIRGDGAFDAFLVRDGRPFARAAHVDRLERSCAALQLPFSRTEVEQDIDRLLTVAPPGDAVVRVILTRGGRRLSRLEGLGDADALTRPVRLLPVVYDPSVVLNG